MMNSQRVSLVVILAITILAKSSAAEQKIYHDGWIDFNKNGKKDIFEDPMQSMDKRIEDLLSQMTMEEKTCQLATLYGYGRVLTDPLPTPDWKNQVWKDGIANIDEMHNGVGKSGSDKNPHIQSPAATARALNIIQHWFIEETRLGIPVEFTNEGIRGACYKGSTNFPSNLSLGASWDRSLVSQVGEVVADESKAIGYRNIYAPIMDLARDPRWGRVVECYGEDPYLVAELGICMVRAIQKQGLASTAKHFAVYSEPKGGRDGNVRVDPRVPPREMEMLHLRPWERIVKEANILGVMSSYNDYDGVAISGSREFLIERLRKQWGFRGYIVSDSAAVEFLYKKHRIAPTMDEACAMYLIEGGNVRTNFSPPQDFILPVRGMIKAGKLPMETVNDRVRDVLRVKLTTGLFDHPFIEDPNQADSVIHTAEHQAIALQAVRESIVLLKNEKKVLPLSKKLNRLLVCGPAAKMEETSRDRYGSSGGEICNVLEGIQAALQSTGTEVTFAEGCYIKDARWPESEIYPEPASGQEVQMIAEAVKKAADADAIVAVLGDPMEAIGESKSRTSLDLPGYQTDLVKELMKTGKPLVVVLLTGRPATINWINRYVPAIIEAWFPGEAGGKAIAEVLFGDYNPGGKLPVTFPRTVGQIPFNFPYKPSSQAAQTQEFNPNGFGNSSANGALYPFGYGLSYTTFEYSDLNIKPSRAANADDIIIIACTIKNIGERMGDEIVQLYIQDVYSSVTTYELNLLGFERVNLKPGQAQSVTFRVPVRSLELINRQYQRVVEPGDFKVMIGASSEDIRLKGQFQYAP